MKTFDVQSVGINAARADVLAFVSNPANLPRWTKAFKSADSKSAQLETPNGAVRIGLETLTHSQAGTIDWKMTFPDDSVGMAYSRVTSEDDARSVYSFVLMAPPVPLEALEGALAAQIKSLAEELLGLKAILEA